MAKTPALAALLAGGLLLAGAASTLAQAPTVELLLHSQFSPKQKDVVISTPSAAEQASCEVKTVAGSQKGSVGYLLLDAKKQPVRRYMGAAKKPIEVFSYFKDGTEVYREVDSNGNGKPDQFRWLNTGGMKWGLDLNEDGKIDTWRMISAEEAGYEAFQALATHDFARLKALFLSEAEMTALKLPAAQVQRLLALQKQAAQKFEEVTRALPQLAKASFVRVEGNPPGCVLGEHMGGESDLIKYASRSLLYESEGADKKEKKHEWLNTGEMIQVGLAWRLIDVPSADGGPGSNEPTPAAANPLLAKLLDALTDLDTKNQGQDGPQTPLYMKSRIRLIQQILEKADAKEAETWYRQLFDNYATLAQVGDADALGSLAKLRKYVADNQPRSGLAAYGTYREIWTQYALDINDAKKSTTEIAKVGEQWLAKLEKFVQDYPTAEDTTPEALQQLGVGAEFAGKDEEAKSRYRQIYKSFPSHMLADKARGAEERLSLVGKELQLKGTQLNGGDFSIADLKGKAVVVYYWASYVDQCVGDFARLKKACDPANKTNLELVCINLDDTSAAAQTYLKNSPVPGVHLYSAAAKGSSGLSSPLAVQYGINGLPTMFLVGRDGKVISNRLQISELESELKKLP
jgi:hypothetical protein